MLLGAPVTLALRVLPGGRRGLRGVLVCLLHSCYVRVVTSPLFTVPMFIASLYGLYFTPLFDVLMGSSLGHHVMLLHFVAVGVVFFWGVMGVDPGPSRSGFPVRLVELFVTMPFHAFFGVAVMMAQGPVVDWFVEERPGWLEGSVASDQSAAGGIAWAFSEVPTVVVLVVLVVGWWLSEERVARRRDRTVERVGDRELVAYNEFLARLGSGGGR